MHKVSMVLPPQTEGNWVGAKVVHAAVGRAGVFFSGGGGGGGFAVVYFCS